VTFVDSSLDGSKILVLADSDHDAGRFYLFDKTKKSMGELMPVRTTLAGRQMPGIKTVSYTASDGTAVPAYLTLPVGKPAKALGAVILPHGGPSSRDYGGFDWLAQFLAARGYAVFQPQYRGSGGFGTSGWVKTVSRAGGRRLPTSLRRRVIWSGKALPIRTSWQSWDGLMVAMRPSSRRQPSRPCTRR
jgi:dipeptidyl aminopeptidase/acylaminoacyl peptidase